MKNKSLLKKLGVSVVATCAMIGLGSCGSDSEIKLYTRDTSSGTRDGFFTGIGFEDAIKDDTVLPEGKVVVADNGAMITSVKNDEFGIGYISLSSLENSGVKGLSFNGVAPTEENVINKSYGLTRNFNYCLRQSYSNEAVEQIVKAMIAYMSTVEGNATIKQHGGILETAATESWNTIKTEYSIASTDNSSVTIRVGGSTSVKGIVSALLTEFSAKCGNFKFEYNPTGSGDAYKRTNGSEKDGANAIDLGFASREFKSDSEAMDESLKGKMCVDAIVAVVNETNSLSNVTSDTLLKIYNGTYTKWSDVE